MKKILVWAILLVFSLSIFTPNTAHAAEPEGSPFIYNLDEGGRQEFSAVTEDGEEIMVVVEEVFPEQNTRNSFSLFSVANGNYRISGKKVGQWEASYYVTVSGDRLTRAYAPVASATTGSFTRTSLALLSNKKASYELAWKYGLLSTTSYLNAILGSSSISITY